MGMVGSVGAEQIELGEAQVEYQEKFLQKSGQMLEWAAQGSVGVTIPGGVQREFRCCVEGRGLARTIGEGQMVGLDDPVGLFQPW